MLHASFRVSSFSWTLTDPGHPRRRRQSEKRVPPYHFPHFMCEPHEIKKKMELT